MFDAVFTELLASIRDGSLARDTDHDETELSALLDVPIEELRGGLQRLSDMGLVRQSGHGTFRLDSVSPERWAESSWVLVGLVEVAMRSSVGALGPAEVERYAELVARAREAASAHDPSALDTAMTDTIRFWGEATPNRVTGRLVLRSVVVDRYGLDPSRPWRIAGIEGWLAASLRAVREGDVAALERAAHVLLRLWHEHITDVAAQLGADPGPMLAPTGDGADAPFWAQWEPDDLWFELLGAVRDGSFRRGERYALAEVARRFRVPGARVLPDVRRLEMMGLVIADDDLGAIRVAEPTIDDWADSIRLLVGLQETAMRACVRRLSADERATATGLVDAAARYARTRDYAYTVSLLELTRFFSARSGNRYLQATVSLALSRLAHILPDPPVYRQWDLDDVFELTREAITTGDPEIASESCHALAVHHEAHIAEVRAARS